MKFKYSKEEQDRIKLQLILNFNIKFKYSNIFLLLLIIIFIFSNMILAQNELMKLDEFQKLSNDKKISYLKSIIASNLYELKLIYYITLTDKPNELFIFWENLIKNTPEPQEQNLKTKRTITLYTIYTFQGKISYIERNISIINQAESLSSESTNEILFIKSIYYLYYSFENSENYIKAKEFITNFLIENKMIAFFFMSHSNLDKIQIIITSNFEHFIEIFTEKFLVKKIKSTRSEELKKEIAKKILVKRPSFILNQLKFLFMNGSNDFNSFLINELASNNNKFNKSDKNKIKKELLNLLKYNFSEVVRKSIYLYFSSSEPSFYIEQFKTFYKNETNIMKKNLVIYLLEINNLSIYRTVLLIYLNENDNWLRNIIFEQIDNHTNKELPANFALEFLKQFHQVKEDRFIVIKSRFLFYLNNDDKVKQEVRLYALSSIDKNFIPEIDLNFSKYLALETDFEIFKKAI